MGEVAKGKDFAVDENMPDNVAGEDIEAKIERMYGWANVIPTEDKQEYLRDVEDLAAALRKAFSKGNTKAE